MNPIFAILVFSALAANGDALALTQEERSEKTIAVASMNKMQTEAVRVIADMIELHAQKAAEGKLIRHNGSGHNDVNGVLESARAFLVDKRKQIRAYKKSSLNQTSGAPACGGWCVAGMIIDGFFILENNQAADCGVMVMLVWWVQGIITLMMDQKLGFDDAVFVLTQQVTSIGYGSHGPSDNGLKIWHALHSMVGVTLAAEPTNEWLDKLSERIILFMSKSTEKSMIKRLKRSLPLALTIIATTFGYAFDLKEAQSITFAQALLDSFYMTIFSLTTVGYGDISPMTTEGKLVGLPVMYFGTRMFGKTFDSAEGDWGEPFSLKCDGLKKKTKVVQVAPELQAEGDEGEASGPTDVVEGGPTDVVEESNALMLESGDSKCIAIDGTCQTGTCVGGNYVSGYCSGAKPKCCVPDLVEPAARELSTVKVDADQVTGYDGYNRFTVRSDIKDDYNNLLAAVHLRGGKITSAGALRSLSAKVSAGRVSTSLHYTGAAFDMSIYACSQKPDKDPYVIEEDSTLGERRWRVWFRSDKDHAGENGVAKRTISVDKLVKNANGGYDREKVSTTGYFFDFTQLADDNGFTGIPAWRSFWAGTKGYTAAEFWHFQCKSCIASGAKFGDQLLKMYTKTQIVNAFGQERWDKAKHIKFGTLGFR